MKREYDFSGAKRGPVLPVPEGKTRITIRIDSDIIDWFRDQVHQAGGGNYQSLINAALREHIRRLDEPLEVILRRVIREEFPKRGARPGPNPAVKRTRSAPLRSPLTANR